MENNHLIKKLLYRSSKMGCKENDIFYGNLAKKIIPSLAYHDLLLFEQLLSESDSDLYCWIMKTLPIPKEYLKFFDAI